MDENIPARTVLSLRAMGHEVSDVRGTPDEAANDDDLWRLVQQERALLVTTDKGFVRHPPCEAYPWDGVGDVRPFSGFATPIVEGVY